MLWYMGVRGWGGATSGEPSLVTSLWGMLYADDAGVISQSPEKLRKMKGMVVVLCAACGLTVSEAKTEIMCLHAKGMPESATILRCTTKRTSSYTSGGISTTLSTCPSRSTGAYARHGPASRSTPSNCTTYRTLPSSSNSGCYEPRYSRQCCTAVSLGSRARAPTTRCAEPTSASRLAASIGGRTIALTTRFPIWTRL